MGHDGENAPWLQTTQEPGDLIGRMKQVLKDLGAGDKVILVIQSLFVGEELGVIDAH